MKDEDGEPRSLFVFRLLPVAEHERRDQDSCGEVLSASAGETIVNDSDVVVDVVEVESDLTKWFERKPLQSVVAERREAALVQRYKHYLERQGHEVNARTIALPGSAGTLRIDLYDETTGELVEAKSSAIRTQVRYAVGQLLDYARHVPHSSLAMLLPSRPSDDLLELIRSLGMHCIYEPRNGQFERLSATEPH